MLHGDTEPASGERERVTERERERRTEREQRKGACGLCRDRNLSYSFTSCLFVLLFRSFIHSFIHSSIHPFICSSSSSSSSSSSPPNNSQHDHENYLATLLLSSRHQGPAFAIRAFNVEVARVWCVFNIRTCLRKQKL